MTSSVKRRYLTKTRFKLAVECPTKLYYTGKSDTYADTKLDDDFLKALAEGGFQVGELARLMFPEGREIKSSLHAEALKQTGEALQAHDVTLFEAAIGHGDLFARVDILCKSGEQVDLIEVKAKSFDSTGSAQFRKKDGGIQKKMLPYLQDVAFQCHVLRLAYPTLKIRAFLMLVDKSKICTVDGLNQKFRIQRGRNGRSQVTVVPGTTLTTIGAPLLSCVNVDEFVDEILREPLSAPGATGTLADLAKSWAEDYGADQKIDPVIGAQCAKCEFRATSDGSGLLSGLHECWRQALGWRDAQIDEGTVLDIWDFRDKQALLDRGIYRLKSVTKEDLKYEEADEGLSRSQRRWMQVSGQWPGGGAFYLDRALMAREMGSWAFPLHFIDFETARVAIPLYKGQRPCANIAFQFSHHQMQADGEVAHRSQFLSTRPGVRPNYEFVRQLKDAIGQQGTVFMWSPHENTTLKEILEELDDDPSPPVDAEQLRATILDLTYEKAGNRYSRRGKRELVDLCQLARLAYFHPSTKASSSIKKVLPAVMQSSSYLRERYSQPIYGAEGGIPSLNFRNQVLWVASDDGVENPYKLLPPVFSDTPQETLERLASDEEMAIAEGGAATTAFVRLQFEDLPIAERAQIEAALLRYCEMDTLAMVMVYEAWREWLRDFRH